MSRFTGFYKYHPVLDPDFDEPWAMFGGLTLAQIRDPIALEFGHYQDLHQYALDKKRWLNIKARRRLDRLSVRLRLGHRDYIQRRVSFLGNKNEWLQYGIKIRLWRDRQRLKLASDSLRQWDPGRGNYRRISWW